MNAHHFQVQNKWKETAFVKRFSKKQKIKKQTKTNL